MAKHKVAKTKREAGETKVEAVDPIPTVMAAKPVVKTEALKTEKPPEVKPAIQPQRDAKQDALNELASEVATIAQGRDAADIVWRFKLRKGGEGGASLKYWQDCKKNEIEKGVPCQYLEPLGAPVTLSLSGKMSAMATPIKGAKKCAGCK
jgi:hypothetical protein